jgi:hypothetical protein
MFATNSLREPDPVAAFVLGRDQPNVSVASNLGFKFNV